MGPPNQNISLLAASDTDPALATELRRWFEEEFGRADRWADADYYVLLSLDEQLAGRLGVLDRKVSVGGEIVRVGGIGGGARSEATRTPVRFPGTLVSGSIPT